MQRRKATARLRGPRAVSSQVPVRRSQEVPSMHPTPMATSPKKLMEPCLAVPFMGGLLSYFRRFLGK